MAYPMPLPFPLIPDETKPDKLKNSAFLAPPLNRYLIPRPPLFYLTHMDREETQRKGPKISSMKGCLDSLKSALKESSVSISKTPQEMRAIKLEEKRKGIEQKLKEDTTRWNPKEDPKVRGDPFHTLFIGRLNHSTTEKQLKREFEKFGYIRHIRVVADKSGKSRGYAFIEFEREKDLKYAYKEADGIKLDGRRIIADIERGRVIKTWKPRRLGQGLGGTRIGGKESNQRDSGRDPKAETLSKPTIIDHRESLKRPRRDSRSRSPERHPRHEKGHGEHERRKRNYEDLEVDRYSKSHHH